MILLALYLYTQPTLNKAETEDLIQSSLLAGYQIGYEDAMYAQDDLELFRLTVNDITTLLEE